MNKEVMEKKPKSEEEVTTVTFTKEDWYHLLRKCDKKNHLECMKYLDSPEEFSFRNKYTLCMCGEFVKRHDWRPHIKCLGRDNAARIDGTRLEWEEFGDWTKTLMQWHDTFTATDGL